MNFLEFFIPLILGHFVADFAIQTDTVAINKCPNNSSKIKINWAWWMTGHVSMHGLIVFFITGNVLVAAAETIIHFYIDYLKSLKEQGSKGRRQLLQFTRYVTVIIAAVQGYGVSIGLESMQTTSVSYTHLTLPTICSV